MMDIFFINKRAYLTTISKFIKYRTTTPLATHTAKDYRSALDEVLRVYNKNGFTVQTIHCDREFQPIFDDILDDLNITMECPPAGDHVPEIEQSIRVIKERVRGMLQLLPYKRMSEPNAHWETLLLAAISLAVEQTVHLSILASHSGMTGAKACLQELKRALQAPQPAYLAVQAR